MDRAKAKKTMEKLKVVIENEFPTASMYFSPGSFDGHAELVIYVYTHDQFDAIYARCKELQLKYDDVDEEYPIWIMPRKRPATPPPKSPELPEVAAFREKLMEKMKKHFVVESL